MTNIPQDYDFVIVGGGSAGAIVAARLAEDPSNRVLVLEAEPENTSYWSRVPLGFAKILLRPQACGVEFSCAVNGGRYAAPEAVRIPVRAARGDSHFTVR